MRGVVMRKTILKITAGATLLAASAASSAAAQMVSEVTADELESALSSAGLSPTMAEDAASGAPVAAGKLGETIFWVRAMGCGGTPAACENLMFFANFDLGRGVTPKDYTVINNYNESKVFGRAYIIESEAQVGVDYVIELGGGVSMDHLSQNIARWADVVAAFIESFRAGYQS